MRLPHLRTMGGYSRTSLSIQCTMRFDVTELETFTDNKVLECSRLIDHVRGMLFLP